MTAATQYLLRFELHAGGTYLLDAWMDASGLAPFIDKPKALTGLARQLSEALAGDEDLVPLDGGLHPLPLVNGHPLEMDWVTDSPCGLEDSQPPARWAFADVLGHAPKTLVNTRSSRVQCQAFIRPMRRRSSPCLPR